MSWHDYETRFRAEARRVRYPAAHLAACLAYAKPLYTRGFPPIYDVAHLAALVGYDSDYLLGCCYATDRFYREFKIPKRSGGERTISEPLPSLKEIQRWILDHVLYSEPVSRYAKGFVRGRGIKENARFHRKQPTVLSLDIRDFFPSIHRHRVYGLFRAFGYSQEVANLLARLCTFRDRLPQGAPTSPAVSNVVTRRVDRRLGGLARKLGLRYTRYADDLTFSGDVSVGRLIPVVRAILQQDGFELNESKNRAMQRHESQEVTGVIVNQRLRAPRALRRLLRQQIHYINAFGLGAHLGRTHEKRARYPYHLMGIATFILHLDPSDADALRAVNVLRPMLSDGTGDDVGIPGG